MKTHTPPVLITFALVCFALVQNTHAVVPPPDGGYPGGNTAEGQNALFSLTSGGFNTAVGFFSLRALATGSFCTGVGAGTLLANTGDENTATGAGALLGNTIGMRNTANGAFALINNTEGFNNTAVGDIALFNNTIGGANTANGFQALFSNITGNSNTAIGQAALYSNTKGNANTAVGNSALSQHQTGSGNNAFGVTALLSDVEGYGNNGFGQAALFLNESGIGNTAIGDSAGFNIDGDYNVCIGAGVEGTSGENNTIRISDNLPDDPGASACFIGGINGQTVANGAAVFIDASGKLGTITSSRRFKEGIKPMDNVSEALFRLQPVAFHYKRKTDPSGRSQFGLVAEDVEKVNPDLIVRDKEGTPYSVRYEAVNAMLLNEFLKEHRKVEEQGATIAQLKQDFQLRLSAQQKQIEALTAGLQKVSAQLELSKSALQVTENDR